MTRHAAPERGGCRDAQVRHAITRLIHYTRRHRIRLYAVNPAYTSAWALAHPA